MNIITRIEERKAEFSESTGQEARHLYVGELQLNELVRYIDNVFESHVQGTHFYMMSGSTTICHLKVFTVNAPNHLGVGR